MVCWWHRECTHSLIFSCTMTYVHAYICIGCVKGMSISCLLISISHAHEFHLVTHVLRGKICTCAFFYWKFAILTEAMNLSLTCGGLSMQTLQVHWQKCLESYKIFSSNFTRCITGASIMQSVEVDALISPCRNATTVYSSKPVEAQNSLATLATLHHVSCLSSTFQYICYVHFS